jgi:hypothetical protein
MAKKSRRLRTPNLPEEAFNIPAAVARPAAEGLSGGSAQTAPAMGSKAIDWQAEYGEVLGDLRKTALIAAGLIAVMAALSVVIR